MRLLLALRCFFLILFAKRLPEEAAALLPQKEPAGLPPPEAEIVKETITPKTVENHLGNAYRKLGVASRGELNDALATRHLKPGQNIR